MTPYDAMEQLKRCWAKLHIAVVDLKDIRESCPWLDFEDKLRFCDLINTAREAEKIASIQLAEWGGAKTMTSLLALYGEGVARGVNCACCFGCVGALTLACIAANEGKSDLARKCLWTLLIFAVVLILCPGPDFFKALAGRP